VQPSDLSFHTTSKTLPVKAKTYCFIFRNFKKELAKLVVDIFFVGTRLALYFWSRMEHELGTGFQRTPQIASHLQHS